jgi:hypothetical protein
MATQKAAQKATRKSARKTTKKGGRKVGKGPQINLLTEPPITIKGGSVEIELDKDIFPPDTPDPKEKKHRNNSKKLATLQITDLKTPPTTLMELDLDELVGGKCIIIVRYR